LMIACDCKAVVEDIHKLIGGPHIIVVKEIVKRRANFERCDFMSEGRDSNKESHNLVKFSVALPQGRYLWLIFPHDPLCIPLNIVSR
jgi:hypothetical protein